MTDINPNQVFEQFEKSVFAPARNYTGLALDHFEKLFEVQYDAIKAYSDLGVQQARAALDIKDHNDVQAYVANQQQVVQSVAERAKGDAEKVVALNQDFAEKAKKAIEGGVSEITKAQKTAAKSASTTAKSASAAK